MIDWLMTPVLQWGEVATTRGELLGFVTGVVTVCLVVRRSIWNWPIGVANVLLLMILFWDAGLYADSALQIVYVVLGLVGWWVWFRGGPGTAGPELVVSRTSPREWAGLLLGGAALTIALWLFLDRLTGSTVPFPDAVTTALSLVATYGQVRKLLESWWFWIAADVVYVPLYAYKGLYLTAVLYVVFLALCVAGLIAWRRALAVPDSPASAPAVGAPSAS